MVWPARPRNIDEIPHHGTSYRDHLSRRGEQIIINFVKHNAHILDEVTEGDYGKECLLGDLLIKMEATRESIELPAALREGDCEA